MSQRVEFAKRRLARADKNVHIIKFVFATYMVIVTGFIVAQQFAVQQNQAVQIKQAQDGLAKSLADNQSQQHKTQDYIKCIASALVVPIAQRDASIFDKCGIETTGSSTAAPTSSSVPATPPPAATRPTPPSSQPTTSSPPDPDSITGTGSTTTQSGPLGSALNPLVTSLDQTLNLILGRR